MLSARVGLLHDRSLYVAAHRLRCNRLDRRSPEAESWRRHGCAAAGPAILNLNSRRRFRTLIASCCDTSSSTSSHTCTVRLGELQPLFQPASQFLGVSSGRLLGLKHWGWYGFQRFQKLAHAYVHSPVWPYGRAFAISDSVNCYLYHVSKRSDALLVFMLVLQNASDPITHATSL